MANLENLDVVSAANRGMMIELLHPGTGEVLDDRTEKEDTEIKRIYDNKKLSNKQRETALGKIRKPKIMFVEVVGTDSDTYRRNARILLKRFPAGKNHDPEKQKLAMCELYAKCTLSCHIVWDDGADSIQCNQDALTKVYLEREYIFEQIMKKIDDRSALMLD